MRTLGRLQSSMDRRLGDAEPLGNRTYGQSFTSQSQDLLAIENRPRPADMFAFAPSGF